LPFEELTAISSVDGRYRHISEALAPYFSEYALIRFRTEVECRYLIALSSARGLGVRRLTDLEKRTLGKLSNISLDDARLIKQIEREGHDGIPATNHDVKAIEYFLKRALRGTSLEDTTEWLHFALTSEDVNSVAYALAFSTALTEAIIPSFEGVQRELDALATRHGNAAMLARTHGQAASPTTFGKEMKVFSKRLERQLGQLRAMRLSVKWGGATGNYNAHMAAAPEVDWRSFARRFVSHLNDGRMVKLELNEFTTQIEPHDSYAEYFDCMRRANTILLDFSQDMWRYISDGWIGQRPKAGEVGSSTMPHKVNPIDFENAEGNLGVANALFEHFSRKLPISRLQRDLSDSTVERAFGTALAHSLIAHQSLMRGFGKITVNTSVMHSALMSHPEVLAEAIQTALRRENVAVPYEKLKALTRGKEVTLKEFAVFIDALDISKETKKRLKALRPETYTGLAAHLAKGE